MFALFIVGIRTKLNSIALVSLLNSRDLIKIDQNFSNNTSQYILILYTTIHHNIKLYHFFPQFGHLPISIN